MRTHATYYYMPYVQTAHHKHLFDSFFSLLVLVLKGSTYIKKRVEDTREHAYNSLFFTSIHAYLLKTRFHLPFSI